MYRLDDRRALVLTTDFFPPVVDDPFDFGRIAAANALSDVYAMGARPLVALNLVAFPTRTQPVTVLGKILEGGGTIVREAGASLVGGHSVEDEEPKYGLAVVGLATPSRIFRNVGARPGDALILTKPLGSGIVTTAIRRGVARPRDIREAVRIMTTLNRTASEVLVRRHRSVHAVTDVTGYGLLGHLLEMLEGSRCGAIIESSAIPLLHAARRLAEQAVVPGGTRANLEAARPRVRFEGSLADDPPMQLVLADAQTSGGLLAAVSNRAAARILSEMTASGVAAVQIGRIVEAPVRIVVRP